MFRDLSGEFPVNESPRAQSSLGVEPIDPHLTYFTHQKHQAPGVRRYSGASGKDLHNRRKQLDFPAVDESAQDLDKDDSFL